MADEGASLSALLPDPSIGNGPRRANSVALKQQLAGLLQGDEGLLYWQGLVDFLRGRINRQEFGRTLKESIGDSKEALRLHNALLLSLLYNTTRLALPPSSLRHSGWHKRKRDKDGLTDGDRDPKRRKLKEAVMALGKRDRAQLKALGLGRREDNVERRTGSLSASMDSNGAKMNQDGLPVALASANGASQPTLADDYLRCLATPLSIESKQLPDVETMRDRMSLMAFDSGLKEGADLRAAQFGVQAVEIYLKAILTSAVDLVRDRRAMASTSTAAPPPPKANGRPSSGPFATDDSSSTSAAADSSSTPRSSSGLTLDTLSALFEMSPQLLNLPHVGTVDRLFAIPQEDTTEYPSGPAYPIQPELATKPFPSTSILALPGTSAAAAATKANGAHGSAAAATNKPTLALTSPKPGSSLQDQLFPELAAAATATAKSAAVPSSPNVATSTDGGSDSENDHGHHQGGAANGHAKPSAMGGVGGGADTKPNKLLGGLTGGAADGSNTNRKHKLGGGISKGKNKSKLYEVVDTEQLLGFLE